MAYSYWVNLKIKISEKNEQSCKNITGVELHEALSHRGCLC